MGEIRVKMRNFLTDPIKRLEYMTNLGAFDCMPDDKFLKMTFKIRMGYDLDLEHPVTFNEKLQWLKLHDRKPEYTRMVDKYEVKKYVADIIGEEYVISTLGVWNHFDEIDFDTLPNQFVLKCTHDSGGLIIVKDKEKMNKYEARKRIEKSLKRNYFYGCREWPYKDVIPRIIAEEYVEDNVDKELRDYKFYCFNGHVEAVLVASNRQNPKKKMCFDYFDADFRHMELVNEWHPNAEEIPHKPRKFAEMKYLAEVMSKGFPHIRVDFYEANDHVYLGELTFSDMGGFLIIHPDDWDKKWGNLIDLTLVSE